MNTYLFPCRSCATPRSAERANIRCPRCRSQNRKRLDEKAFLRLQRKLEREQRHELRTEEYRAAAEAKACNTPYEIAAQQVEQESGYHRIFWIYAARGSDPKMIALNEAHVFRMRELAGLKQGPKELKPSRVQNRKNLSISAN